MNKKEYNIGYKNIFKKSNYVMSFELLPFVYYPLLLFSYIAFFWQALPHLILGRECNYQVLSVYFQNFNS